MSRFENILLASLGSLSVLSLVGEHGNSGALTLTLIVLALVYSGGAYWLFRIRPAAPPTWLRIISGFCIAAALLQLINSIRLQRGSYEQVTPAVLGLLCTGLTVYLVINRRQPERVAAYRPLLIRSAVVCTVCAFFAYGSSHLSLSRTILLVVNQDRPLLKQNLLMFEYTEHTEKALEEKDCTTAIVYARKAYAAGHQWLKQDSITKRYKINGVYSNLYKAYRCQGDVNYDQQRYVQALRSYQLGHAVLMRGDYRSGADASPLVFWLEEEAWSLNNMAYCYLKANQINQSDSLFLRAFYVYRQRHPQPTAETARLISDLARSQAAGQHWEASSKLFRRANQIYTQGFAATHKTELMANRLDLVFNALNQDSLPAALRQLHTLRFDPADSLDWAKAHLYEGIGCYKQSKYQRADSLLGLSLRYYQGHRPAESVSEAASKLLLAKNSLAQAEYAQAQAYARSARALLLAHASPTTTRQALNGTAILAAIDKALGRYNTAAQQYAQVLNAYQQNQESGPSQATILTELADLDVTLDDLLAADRHIAGAFALIDQDAPIFLPSQTGFLTTAAYVDYAVGRTEAARARYAQVVDINRRFGQASSLTTAVALHGLGLLETERQGLARADSLFAAALALHQRLLGEQHPLTATVYLNYGLLRVRQHRLPEAEAFIQRARQSIVRVLPPDHDIAGDLYAALGDVANEQAQYAEAQVYYHRALHIYEQKFSPAHWKVRRIKHRLAA